MIFLFQCLECEGLFCPQKFVCHSHNPKNRTCHWGFDSDNWRSYLHLAEDYTDSEMEKLSKIVTDFKNRYKPTSTSTAITSKRKTVRHKNQLKSFDSYNPNTDICEVTFLVRNIWQRPKGLQTDHLLYKVILMSKASSLTLFR